MADASEPSPFLPAQACMAGCALLVLVPLLIVAALVVLVTFIFAIPGVGPLVLFLVLAGGIAAVVERVQKWRQRRRNRSQTGE